MMGCDGSMMFGMFLLWVLVAAAVVAGVIFLLRAFGSGNRDGGGALAILEERYARGEVDEEEFARRREALWGRR